MKNVNFFRAVVVGKMGFEFTGNKFFNPLKVYKNSRTVHCLSMAVSYFAFHSGEFNSVI